MLALPPRFLALLTMSLLVDGCSSGSQSVAPVAPPVATFKTATNAICVTPSTASQVVSLPATGGVTGSISFGAFATGASGCDEVVVSTGADATPPAADALRGGVRRDATTDTPAPILTVSVGVAFGSVPIFGFSQIVTGLNVMGVPSNLPDGTYYATITDTGIYGTITSNPFPIVAKNGVLTVGQTAAGPYVNGAYSSATFTLYGLGVTPPDNKATPSPVPTASPTATPVLTPSPQPTPSVTPTPNSSPTPVASPTPINADFNFSEPPFVPACYPASCTISMISTMSVTTATGQFVVTVNGTYVPAGQSTPAAYNESAVYSDQLLNVDTTDGDPLSIVGNGNLNEVIFSTCDSTDDAQCGNSSGGESEIYLYFDTQADEDTFNAKFAAYRANTGSYDFLANPPKVNVTQRPDVVHR